MTPLLKKIDPIDKTNYRPVSILTVASKIYENILSQQLSAYFENIFDKYIDVHSARGKVVRRFCWDCWRIGGQPWTIRYMPRLSRWICLRHLTANCIKSSYRSCMHMAYPMKQYYFQKIICQIESNELN